jgi:hypothetical protein
MNRKRGLWLATGSVLITALVIWVAAGVIQDLEWVRVADLERLDEAEVIYDSKLKVFVVARDRDPSRCQQLAPIVQTWGNAFSSVDRAGCSKPLMGRSSTSTAPTSQGPPRGGWTASRSRSRGARSTSTRMTSLPALHGENLTLKSPAAHSAWRIPEKDRLASSPTSIRDVSAGTRCRLGRRRSRRPWTFAALFLHAVISRPRSPQSRRRDGRCRAHERHRL